MVKIEVLQLFSKTLFTYLFLNRQLPNRSKYFKKINIVTSIRRETTEKVDIGVEISLNEHEVITRVVEDEPRIRWYNQRSSTNPLRFVEHFLSRSL